MRIAAWVTLGLILGLALGASAQRRYTYFYDSGEMSSKSDALRTGYVAGVFDSLGEIVKANDKKSPGWQPANLARAYTCMQGVSAISLGALANEAKDVWVRNPKEPAAYTLLFVAGNMSFGDCKMR